MNREYYETETDFIAKQLLGALAISGNGATVLALEGELGAGKTTLTQALAKALGVTENLVSPTFVIFKKYQTDDLRFQTLVHMDAYRIEQVEELLPLRFSELLAEPKTLLVVEWPEKIERALPIEKNHYKITHAGLKRILEKIS